MRKPILMPDVGDEAPVLNLWFAQPGERVYSGERMVEVLLDGATFDVSSPADGLLAALAARSGERLAPGQVLGWIDEDG